MNGLSLRIASGSKGHKDTMSFPPVRLDTFIGQRNELIEGFVSATTADQQLAILKQILAPNQDDNNSQLLSMWIIKNQDLHQPFINLLVKEISTNFSTPSDIGQPSVIRKYEHYKQVVSRVAMCIENFPQGAQAVRTVEIELAEYLTKCLCNCQEIVTTHNITPSVKSDIYSVIHLALRLVHHLITKTQTDTQGNICSPEIIQQVIGEKHIIRDILKDKEVPMDTKCLCGIVILSLDQHSDNLQTILEKCNSCTDDHVRLAMYSAAVTALEMEQLQEITEGERPAISVIIQQFMEIVERGSGDGVLILGVARAMHQISKRLSQLAPGTGGAAAGTGDAAADTLLRFVWAHLDHFMDSVRHLAHQSLAALLQYCAERDSLEGGSSVERVLSDLGSRGWSRGLLAGAGGAARAAGARRVLRALPLCSLLPALCHDHVAAQASTTFHALLELYCRETDSANIHKEWVLPIIEFIRSNDLDCQVLTVLEKLLAKAVKLEPELLGFIVPHIEEAFASADRGRLRLVMTLSCAVRSARGGNQGLSDDYMYKILEKAIVDANDEVRIQCLSLLSGGGGAPSRLACAVARRYVRHCSAAQAPHTRQRANTHLNKFVKRVIEAHRAAVRSNDASSAEWYREFAADLSQLCVAGLCPGANYSRRVTALQLLQALSPLASPWKVEYVEQLVLCLEDSYEGNKVLALDILMEVPVEIIKETPSSAYLKLTDVLSQANALQPTECISAAYKLDLMCKKLPERILCGHNCSAPSPVIYTALRSLLSFLEQSLHKGPYNVLSAPRDHPTYGLLYCMQHLIDGTRFSDVGDDSQWRALVQEMIRTCSSVIRDARVVVNNASPEGALPVHCQFTDFGNNAGVELQDGRQVTAQMVLLCAWRTVKEGTGVLGALGSLAGPGLLPWTELISLAEFLGTVLTEARHRGAFEQAYVAYQRVLHRMWRDPDPLVRRWPEQQLDLTLTRLKNPTSRTDASRRSAGLPFLVQALVSSQQGTAGQGGGALRAVAEALLTSARTATNPDARAHASNVLRALYRDSSLDTAVQSYVGEGLRVAILGFEGATWAERNSSTLLLSALVQRVFGVSRARAALTARDRMTGRVFFLRYPQLFDVMSEKLKEVSESEEKLLLSPSLYPVLLLLGRLYPSSLEGTESNIKLVSLVPSVVSCARSRVLATRRLAAAAAVSLVTADRYAQHLDYLVGLISAPAVERNFCHGILLQICALLDNKPPKVEVNNVSIHRTNWILLQPPDRTCYPLLNQYIHMMTALLNSFPETLEEENLTFMEDQLKNILLSTPSSVASGRAICLQDCLALALTLQERKGRHESAADLVITGLKHPVYEVNSAALDYVLRLHGRPTADIDSGDRDSKVSISLDEAYNVAALEALRSRDFLSLVVSAALPRDIWTRDPHRAAKILHVLVVEDAVNEILRISHVSEDKPDLPLPLALCRLAERNDERTHLYLEALTRHLSRQLLDSNTSHSARHLRTCLCAVARACGPGASRGARAVAARFLRTHYQDLIDYVETLSGDDLRYSFEIEMLPAVALSWLLRDEEASLRTIAGAALWPEGSQTFVESVSLCSLLSRCGSGPAAARRLAALGLTTPTRDRHDTDISAECRVFEESEKFNVYSEEELWAADCARAFLRACAAPPGPLAAPPGPLTPGDTLDAILQERSDYLFTAARDSRVMAVFRAHLIL